MPTDRLAFSFPDLACWGFVAAPFNDPEASATMAKQDNCISPTTPDTAAKFLNSGQAR